MATDASVPAPDGTSIPIALAAPDALGPAVVIVPAILGVTDEIRTRLDEYAAAGVLAAALDPFHRVDPGPVGPDELPRAMARAKATDPDGCYGDLSSLIDHVRRQPGCNGKLVAVGICFGGRYAWRAAADGRVDGAATWHGGGIGELAHLAERIRCPLSLQFGGADSSIPVEEVDRIRAALQGHGNVEIALHPGAQHGFTHRGAPMFDEAANAAAENGVRTILAGLR
ncbi:MAG: dienelactone hydrolase family protein [Sandaracinaceae bacterium]